MSRDLRGHLNSRLDSSFRGQLMRRFPGCVTTHLAGVKSESIDKAVLQVDIGLEFDATRIGSNWRHTLRFGLSGWLPSETVTVNDGGLASQLHQSGLSVGAVWTFNYQ